MLWTPIVLLLLVVTGGFISYYGDLQGRRWGKKRVSWFGLRPKHTAIVVTSITGSVITLMSVAAVMLVVPTVRDVVLRGEAAINENQRLRKESKAELDAKQNELKAIKVQLATTKAEKEETERLASGAKLELDKLRQTNDGLDKKNNTLISKNMDLQRTGAGLERSIQKNHQVIEEQNRVIARGEIFNRELARQNTQFSRDNTVLARENDKLQTANGKLKNSNQALTDANQQLKSANETLLADKSRLQKNYETADHAYQGLLESNKQLQDAEFQGKRRLARLQTQYDDLEQQRNELSIELMGRSRDFARTYMALRQTRYNLRADTELARRTVDAHLSPQAAKDELMALLNAASDRARQFGASAGENGRAVAIVPKRVITPASVQVADEGASVNAIVDTVAGSSTPVVVVVRAINNSVPGEQVVIELSSFTSMTVFKQGEAVANREIDARQPVEALVGSVVRFLKEDVRNAAIKAGTIPNISPDTGEEEVGKIDTPEMITLVDRIRRMGGNVQLTAVANEDLTSADLLTFGQARGGKPHNLRFDLKRMSGKARVKAEAATQ